ncbi:heterokaryon incompatibility protein [Colletotrichum musicola]|uniref:Heterokaryon incompatibility protein n=1 Tax=Colletotrichum musicola TaxID=2175873 RepID=A0A8H6N8X9_9PEZI|nr:heterokaryon incompatibility protein [Colletotrichum musicola]
MQNGSLCDTPYQGQALDQEFSFRLLELQPGQPGSSIVVCLLTVDLSSAPSYEALSYTWGDVTKVEEIEVITTTNEESKSAPLSVTTSCAAALRRLRSSVSPRTLWIDFICINQSDVPERNHQLALMPRIYNGASRVVVYLGEGSESDSSDAVMLWLQDIHSPSEPANAPPIPQSDTVRAFLNRRWFTRVWVMQEVRLAKDVTVICGDKEVPWDAFRMLRDIFNNKRREQPLPYTIQSLVPQEYNRYSWRPSYLVRLFETLQNTRDFGATDPRDKLYAILPLLDWESRQCLKNNPEAQVESAEEAGFAVSKCGYSLSTAQLFTSLAQDLIRSLGLNVLRTAIAPSKVPDLPTWATDWNATGLRRFRGRHLGRGYQPRAHDGLSPVAYYRFSGYSTSEGKQNTQLHVRAAQIGTIVKLGELCDVYNEILPLGQWRSLCDPAHVEAVYPTNEDGRSERKISPFTRLLFGPRIVYFNAVRRAAKKIKEFESGQASTAERRPMKELFYGMPPSYEAQAEAIFHNCHGRRIFITDRGQLGLAPHSTSVGDQVMSMAGADMPFVMRSLGGEPGLVTLIGSCEPMQLLESQGEHEDMIIL